MEICEKSFKNPLKLDFQYPFPPFLYDKGKELSTTSNFNLYSIVKYGLVYVFHLKILNPWISLMGA